MDPDVTLLYHEMGKEHFWLTSKYFVLRQLLAQYASISATSNQILEVGCGTGNFIRAFENVRETHGVDQSRSALQICRQNAKRTKVYMAEGDHLPFRRQIFRLVALVDVLEHIEDDRSAVREAFTVLEDQGLLLVCVPAYQWLYGDHDKLFGHLRRYSRKQISRLVTAEGFEILRLSHIQPLFLLPLWLKRKLSGGNDFKPVQTTMNRTLAWVLRQDARALRHFDLPFGPTLVCLCRRKAKEEAA